MPRENISNFARSNLSDAISSSALSMSVLPGEGARFPASNFHIFIDTEVIYCSLRTGDVFTIVRGQKGSIATLHAINAAVYHGPLAHNVAFAPQETRYTTPGTFTYYIPFGATRLAMLALGGGGGGQAGAVGDDTSSSLAGGKGGGGGGLGESEINLADLPTKTIGFTVVVGAGGSGGVSSRVVGTGATGTSGGDSKVSLPNGTVVCGAQGGLRSTLATDPVEFGGGWQSVPSGIGGAPAGGAGATVNDVGNSVTVQAEGGWRPTHRGGGANAGAASQISTGNASNGVAGAIGPIPGDGGGGGGGKYESYSIVGQGAAGGYGAGGGGGGAAGSGLGGSDQSPNGGAGGSGVVIITAFFD